MTLSVSVVPFGVSTLLFALFRVIIWRLDNRCRDTRHTSAIEVSYDVPRPHLFFQNIVSAPGRGVSRFSATFSRSRVDCRREARN
jgi:hypothetical protein